MDIVLSFVLNMKNQAQYSANILYILFFIVLGKRLHVYLPEKKVLFVKVFLYCVLKMETLCFCVV